MDPIKIDPSRVESCRPDFATAARESVAHGLKVFPVWPPVSAIDGTVTCGCGNPNCSDIGKHPIGHLGPRGHLSATTNLDVIDEWNRARPDANVGVALTRLVVVAPDSPGWNDTFKARGLPETYVVRSGGGDGHLHYYYRLPDSWPTTRVCQSEQYDIMSAGYVVGAGSLHESGRTYDVVSDAPIEDAPGWILDVLSTAPSHVGFEPVDPSEPPVRLTNTWQRDVWNGVVRSRKPDGDDDRSLTLWNIGHMLARAGATKRAIVDALRERDLALFSDPKYADRSDAEKRYVEIADKTLRSFALSHVSPVYGATAFPLDALPELSRRFVTESAEAVGVPPEMVAAPFLAAAGAVIGNTARIQLKRGYTQFPILWTVIVSPPGRAKTPAIAAALRPLKSLQDIAYVKYELDRAIWKRQKSEDKHAGQPEPKLESYFTTNATPEALHVILTDSAGVLIVNDELVGWVRSMDAYRGGRAGERQAHLSAWAGASFKIDRKTSEPMYISHPVIAVTGGIQTDLLGELRDELNRDDGFLDRILWTMPEVPALRWSEATVSQDTLDAMEGLFRQLRWVDENPDVDADMGHTLLTPRTFRLTDEAKALWVAWHGDNADRIEATTGLMSGAYAKLPNQLARLALILHLLVDPQTDGDIPSTTMESAINLVEYFAGQAALVIDVLLGVTRQSMADRILSVLQDRGTWTARSDIWSALGRHTTKDELDAALEELLQRNLVSKRMEATKGRAVELWRATTTESEGEVT